MHQHLLSIPLLWIGNAVFMLLSSCAPVLLSKWQSNAFTSQILRNFGHKNFILQSVTGYVYHQTVFNIWTHILTFPIDLTLWACYFNYYGKVWIPQFPDMLYWFHYLICVIQLISISIVSNIEKRNYKGNNSLGITCCYNLGYEFYSIQFIITCFFFSFWYFFIPFNLFRIFPVANDPILINFLLLFNALLRSIGHCSDYIPPIMVKHIDLPFTSIGKGFSAFLQFTFDWRVLIFFPLGILSELCAGYPGRLYVWRLMANLRRIFNFIGIKDEDQTFLSLNWKLIDEAKFNITNQGWNSWSITKPLFHWAKQGETELI